MSLTGQAWHFEATTYENEGSVDSRPLRAKSLPSLQSCESSKNKVRQEQPPPGPHPRLETGPLILKGKQTGRGRGASCEAEGWAQKSSLFPSRKGNDQR